MMAEAARWAAAEGAHSLALVVTRRNDAANALYRAIGMEATCFYHYRREVAA